MDLSKWYFPRKDVLFNGLKISKPRQSRLFLVILLILLTPCWSSLAQSLFISAERGALERTMLKQQGAC